MFMFMPFLREHLNNTKQGVPPIPQRPPLGCGYRPRHHIPPQPTPSSLHGGEMTILKHNWSSRELNVWKFWDVPLTKYSNLETGSNLILCCVVCSVNLMWVKIDAWVMYVILFVKCVKPKLSLRWFRLNRKSQHKCHDCVLWGGIYLWNKITFFLE